MFMKINSIYLVDAFGVVEVLIKIQLMFFRRVIHFVLARIIHTLINLHFDFI
jgi:hypothetical protein